MAASTTMAMIATPTMSGSIPVEEPDEFEAGGPELAFGLTVTLWELSTSYPRWSVTTTVIVSVPADSGVKL